MNEKPEVHITPVILKCAHRYFHSYLEMNEKKKKKKKKKRKKKKKGINCQFL